MDKKLKKAKRLDLIGITSGCVLLLILLINIILAGVSAAKNAVPKDALTLTGMADGRNGDVIVEVVATPEKIYSVTVTQQSETEGIGSLAVEQMPGKIVNAQRLDVDAVATATLTSDAIKYAVADALNKGGIDPAAFGGALAPTLELEGPVTGEDGRVTAQGSGKGIDGPVVVEVTADASTIYSVEVLEQNETQGIGSVAVEQLPGQIVATNSILVDAISGATITSTAIKDGVREALTSAGLDVSVFEVEPLAAAAGDKEAVKLEYDVVVVGAGGAGLTAAVRATQEGAKVLVLEKMPFVGGNSLRAEGGMNAADTKVEAELGLTDSTVENFVADTLRLGHDLADPKLVQTMAENSAEAVDWLFSIDAPLTKVAATGGTEHKYLHKPEDGSPVGEYLVDKLKTQVEKLDIDVMVNTKATEILMNGGKASGVVAEDSGHVYTVKAKAVVLATGGFGANFDLMASYDPSLADAVTTNHSGAQGDGIMMAQAVGADTVDMEQIQLHPTVIQSNGLLVSESVRSHGAILVNAEGKRFVNDMAGRDVVSQAELKQPGSYAYIIFDQALVDEVALTHKFIDGGYTITGETYEELAKNMGLEGDAVQNFVNTMTTWEEYVAAGEDKDFGRSQVSMIDIFTAPYYAIKIAPGIHHTMGGIKINSQAQVIDTDGNVIPGLFACGETTGGIHGGNRVGGNAVCDFIVFGRIAGDSAYGYAFGAANKVQTMSGVTVMHADDWKTKFPDQYNSWAATANNDELVDYLELNPYLRTLYEGYGFAKDYKGARGHYYDVMDIEETGRPHPLANCWTCKTPDFTNMVNEMGVEAYKLDWTEVQKQVTDPISCYNCHANDPMSLTVTHTYWIDALGEDYNQVPAADMVCGQCHNEYYFEPETKATTIAHNSLESMAPETILAYFNDPANFVTGEAFSDWTNPRTGVKQIKVQHPEFETVLGAGSIIGADFNCADCHMPQATNEKGMTYSSHELVTPLTDQSIFESKCTECHTDGYDSFVTMIRGVQDQVKTRTDEIGYKLQDLTNFLAEAVETGKFTDEDLANIRSLARDAQFYWDFVFVENSDGAHNSALSNACLDKAEALCGQAMDELVVLMDKIAA